jgi:hypothetical protein
MENKEETLTSENLPAPSQDWGKMIGASSIIFVILVTSVNLLTFKIPAGLLEKLAISPICLQTGRWSGLLLTLSIGGLLLWKILRQP